MARRYAVEITRRAQKDIKKLDRQVQRRVLDAIDTLRREPRPRGVKPLKESPFYRVRVGDYRIIYNVEEDRLLVLVIRVRHRREAYR